MSSVAERERKHFVTELHDDALQKLTAAELQLARLVQQETSDPSSLETVRSLLDDTESSLRRLVFEVRPPALESQPSHPALGLLEQAPHCFERPGVGHIGR